jgi:hypothetical protein
VASADWSSARVPNTRSPALSTSRHAFGVDDEVVRRRGPRGSPRAHAPSRSSGWRRRAVVEPVHDDARDDARRPVHRDVRPAIEPLDPPEHRIGRSRAAPDPRTPSRTGWPALPRSPRRSGRPSRSSSGSRGHPRHGEGGAGAAGPCARCGTAPRRSPRRPAARRCSCSIERVDRERDREPEGRQDADELAAVLEGLGHHRVREHREDRSRREAEDERDGVRG